MKKTKKLKFITSLSSVAALALTVPAVATACTTAFNSQSLYGPNPNAKTIDVTTIKWVKKSKYSYKTEAEIKNAVKQDNSAIFAVYSGLEDVMTIGVTIEDTTITISLTNDGSNERYTGATETPITWTATYTNPTPAVKTDISTLNWSIEGTYDITVAGAQTVADKVTDAIKTDNSSGKGADISDWNNITINVNMSNGNIVVYIVADDANKTYRGNVRWTAGIYEDLSSYVLDDAKTKFTSFTFTGTRIGNQITLYFFSDGNSLAQKGACILTDFTGTIWANSLWTLVGLADMGGDTEIGNVLIELNHTIHIYTASKALSNTKVGFTLNYTAAN